MSFDHNNLPITVREAWAQKPSDWKLVVQRCFVVGINDPNKLADFVYYLTYPEREGSPIAASDQKAIEQWKYCRAQVKDFLGVQQNAKTPYIPTTPAKNWVFTEDEWNDVRRNWGNEVVAWAKIPPSGKEAKEFAPPDWLKADFATVFFWKSADPSCDRIANRRKSLQGLAMIRDDMWYWKKRWSVSDVGARVLQSTAETAIRDYRSFIIDRKMCPESAKLRLQAISKDVIYQLFLGMFQLLSPQGLKGAGQFDGQIVDILNKLIPKIFQEEKKKDPNFEEPSYFWPSNP